MHRCVRPHQLIAAFPVDRRLVLRAPTGADRPSRMCTTSSPAFRTFFTALPFKRTDVIGLSAAARIESCSIQKDRLLLRQSTDDNGVKLLEHSCQFDKAIRS